MEFEEHKGASGTWCDRDIVTCVYASMAYLGVGGGGGGGGVVVGVGVMGWAGGETRG